MVSHHKIHFVVRVLNKGDEDNETIKCFITHNLEKHVREYPGQKIAILINMSEAGIRHLDYDLVKFIIASKQNFYSV
ncbi:unnamed protein product [Rotaria sp. Silwood1]|nr:unnamed protein product [Rotaria sp. Silwood1]CAF1649457.1 unnamed protein product [Rotaria sp. Silwood1]CAF3810939.1 unnamed protein product [Rotaria sp. Silwood1]CAF3833491.1 unnamed protein product [Rotaria sp. Silwood1]CAF4726458.1 unnamed protein product [Rotaria sp. Silwood1]